MKRISIQLSDGTKIVLNNDILINTELLLGVKIATLVDSLGLRQDVFAPLPDDINLTVNGLTAFANIEALKAASGLEAGDTVMTKGYYSINDGGGSFFNIISSTSDTVLNYAGKNWKLTKSEETTPYVDDATLILLPNGLYADMIVPSNGTINFLQMGARKMSIIHSKSPKLISLPDNKPYMMKWLAFLDRKKSTYNLYISDGIYSFSETWLLRSDGNLSCMGVRIYGECSQSSGGEGSIIIPHYMELLFIFRIGYFDSDKTKSIGMRQVVLQNLNFGTTLYAWLGNSLVSKGMNIGSTYVLSSESGTTGNNFIRYVTKGVLWLENCPYGQFEGLYFQNVSGTSMYLTQCYESHFGYTNIRGCGRMTAAGYLYPMVYINAPGPSSVSACYFYYFNFEGCYGDYFYSKTANFTHNEFNNILIEGALGVTLPSIRYTDDELIPIAVDNASTGLNKSPLYSSLLSLPTELTTYKARAFSGTTPVSGTSTVIYNPEDSVLPPAIKIKHEGIKMYCATRGATIYYTTDGTDPTSASTQYTGRIESPSENTEFKAIAILNGESSTISTTPYKVGLETQAPEIVVKSGGIIMRVTNKGNTRYAAIDKQSSSLKYDTDPDYSIPTFEEDDEVYAVFGKWVKLFVFTGNMGSYPNYINSISASNFGNGFKKYRTYRISDGDILDMDGNVITDSSSYILDNGVYYAVDSLGRKIIDYYRYYALFGEDENNPRDIQMVSGTPVFGSFVWNIGSVYLYRLPGLDTYCGPWVVYLRIKPKGFHLAINHTFSKKEYPYYFDNMLKGDFAVELCNMPGAIPFYSLLYGGNGAQALVSTYSGSCSPNGLCVKYKNAFSFIAMPNVKYSFRAYCPESVYNTLLLYNSSGGYPLLKWKGLLCIDSTSNPYSGTATSVIKNSEWIDVQLPDLGITKPTPIYFGASGLFDAYSRNFLMGLYLDVICPAGSFSN